VLVTGENGQGEESLTHTQTQNDQERDFFHEWSWMMAKKSSWPIPFLAIPQSESYRYRHTGLLLLLCSFCFTVESLHDHPPHDCLSRRYPPKTAYALLCYNNPTLLCCNSCTIR